MVQQRKAQRKESVGQKQSLLPVRANKKQFTVPHPLSGKLQVAREGWRDCRILGLGPSPKLVVQMVSLPYAGLMFAQVPKPQGHTACPGSQPILRDYIRH